MKPRKIRIYRVHLWSVEDGSCGFSFHPTKFSAETQASEDRVRFKIDEKIGDKVTIESRSINPDMDGIIGLLNRWAEHVDNG